MEQRANLSEERTTVFVRLVKPGAEGPVSGWSFGTGTEKVEVWRQEGETDEDLQQRAGHLAVEHKDWGNVLLFNITADRQA